MRNLKVKNLKFKVRYGGFTLVETMVAIFILMIAVISPMSIASHALSSARFAKEQVTAFYLAQEGVELARNIRDNNVLSGTTWSEGTLGQASLGSACYSAEGCMIEPTNLLVTNCQIGCDILNIDENGIYTYNTTGTIPSAFTRTVKVTKLSASEISISSVISWISPTVGRTQSFTITDNLLNWQ